MIEKQFSIIPELKLSIDQVLLIPEGFTYKDAENAYLKIYQNEYYDEEFFINSGVKKEILEFLIANNKVKITFQEIQEKTEKELESDRIAENLKAHNLAYSRDGNIFYALYQTPEPKPSSETWGIGSPG